MPRLRKTPEQLRMDSRQAVRDNTISIIRINMAKSGVKTIKDLSELTGLEYQRLTRQMRGHADFDGWAMAKIAEELLIDEEGRAGMIEITPSVRRKKVKATD